VSGSWGGTAAVSWLFMGKQEGERPPTHDVRHAKHWFSRPAAPTHAHTHLLRDLAFQDIRVHGGRAKLSQDAIVLRGSRGQGGGGRARARRRRSVGGVGAPTPATPPG
jgi:hypothetical protein